MAFKRLSVRSRYPPLHNPLENQGVVSFLGRGMNRRWDRGATPWAKIEFFGRFARIRSEEGMPPCLPMLRSIHAVISETLP